MESAIATSELATPYVVHFGEADSGQQFFVVCEKVLVTEAGSFIEAMVALMAVYYIFDIAYPKACTNTLLFVEKFLLKITTGPQISQASMRTVSDIQKAYSI